MRVDRLLVPRVVLDHWRFRITPAGQLLLGLILFSGLGAITVLVPIYQIFFCLLTLMAGSWVVGRLFAPKFDVKTPPLPRMRTGQSVTIDVTLTNRSRRPAFDVMLAFVGLPASVRHENPADSIAYLPAGDTVTFPLTLRFQRRGMYELPPLRPHTTFPFNFRRQGRIKHDLGPALVLPDYHPLRSISLETGSRYQPGGVALTSHIGESPEYIGNREYIPGEPVRRLDVKGWARLGRPVVREYQEEYYCRIAVVLDTDPPPRNTRLFYRDASGQLRTGIAVGEDGTLRIGRDAIDSTDPVLESAVSLTAAIGDALSDGEYLIDLFAAGPNLHVFRGGRHTANFSNLLDLLAAVERCPVDPFGEITPKIAEELGRISSVVCIFTRWTESRRTLCRRILEAGCGLKAIAVRTSDDGERLDAGEVLDFHEVSITDINGGEVAEL